jgi:hypothetical protein
MPKLLRLLGDAVKSSTEIRNTFRQPIIVNPNAKVALVGISAFLTDEIANEKYIIDDNNNQFKIGGGTINDQELLTATISNGDYTPQGLLRVTEVAANLTGNDTSGVGIHHSFLYNENYATIQTHYSAPDNNAMFNNWVRVLTPFPFTGTENDVSFAGLTRLRDKTANIPMVHSRFSATLNNANTNRVSIYAQGGVGNFNNPQGDLYGFEASGGTYYSIVNSSTSPIAISASANDQVIIELFNKSLKITINDSAGTLKGIFSAINQVKEKYYNTGNPLNWGMVGVSGTIVSNAFCTRLTNSPTSNKHQLTDDYIFAGLRFENASNVVNRQLALFLGFPTAGNSLEEYSGNPAVLPATSRMKGLPQYPGILVVVDGLGAFQSFDGASSSRSQDNIIYVLHDLSVVNANIIQLDVPAPFYLDINNSNPINVNELRVRLLPASGQESNPVLTFTGKPCITLLIED